MISICNHATKFISRRTVLTKQQRKFGTCNAREIKTEKYECAMWELARGSTHVVSILVRVSFEHSFFCHSLNTSQYKPHNTTHKNPQRSQARRNQCFSVLYHELKMSALRKTFRG